MTPERVLLRAPNWVGDVVLSLPALRDVRRAFAGSRLDVLAQPRVAQLYAAVAEVDAVRTSRGFRADVAALRGAYELALLFTNSFGTALVAARAGIPERWGYAREGRGFLLTRAPRVPAAARGHSEAEYYRLLLRGLGLPVSEAVDAHLDCPPEWAARGRGLLGDDGGAGFVGLSAGAFFGGAKRWLPERFAAVGELLARETGAGIVLLGSPGERPLAEHVAAGMPRARVVNLCGATDLAGLVGVIAGLRLLVSGDSGPMHVAAALGVPVAAVFGPTDWRETAPLGGRCRLVREPVACAPCKLRECPIDHRCMRRVDVARVLEAARELMTASGATLGARPVL
jgi:heptosyltransferase-2